MRITKKWLYVALAIATAIIVALALQGCALIPDGDRNNDGITTAEEAHATSKETLGSIGIPSEGLYGGLGALLLGIAIYAKGKLKKKPAGEAKA